VSIHFSELEEVTMKRMSMIIGNYMRIIPHVEATIVVDLVKESPMGKEFIRLSWLDS